MAFSLPPGCRKFSKQILIWDRQQNTSSEAPKPGSEITEISNASSPDIILLFTWADAQPRHYAKYIEGYQNLYPTAKIILTEATTLATFFAGQKAAQLIVRDMVYQEIIPLYKNSSYSPESPRSGPRMLAHVFSNSGGLNLEATWSVWKEVFGKDVPLPLTTLILDSTPGGMWYTNEFGRWTMGVSLGFETVFPKAISWIIAAMIVTCMLVVPQILGIEIMVTRGPKGLNQAQNIPRESSRLYFYSTSDQLIWWQDVETHAEDAKSKGFEDLILERFDGSSHVSHLRLDASRYWNAVWKAWNAGCRT